MAIDHELRSKGIGGSEIAAILGMDANRDAFSVYADKWRLLERAKPNARMRWGSLLEKAIAEGYSEETGFQVMWSNVSRAHATRPWQVYSIDAFVAENPERYNYDGLHYDGLLDCKNVDFSRAHTWGERGTDDVPTHILLQIQWYCSAADLPWGDVAALFGGNDLRIYRVHRDKDIEAAILEAAERFWFDHVVVKVPPPLGANQAASDYLKQRFPRNVEQLRAATADEHELLVKLKDVRERWDIINTECTTIENQTKLAIGDADGLIDGEAKVTWKRCKDSLGTSWEAAAHEVIEELATVLCAGVDDLVPNFIADRKRALIGKHCIVTKEGFRKLLVNFGKK